MQVSNMLTEPRVAGAQCFPEVEELIAGRHHDSMQSAVGYDMMPQREDSSMMDVYPSTETGSAHDSLSPSKQLPKKHVSFELLLPQTPGTKARLPMRVDIYPHDTTDSIITTVKNFYGLYERRGVIFEDRHGNTLIARFENFEHGMTVYVRVSPENPDADDYSPDPRQPTISPRRPRPHLDEAFQMLPPMLHHPAGSRAGSRHARQSHSPQPGRGRRSASVTKRMRPYTKSRCNSSHGSFAEANGDGYSDSEGENGSVSSSRRSRKEPLASAEISVDNIVEGGRRKRAKFDSSVSTLRRDVLRNCLTPVPSTGATSVRSTSSSHSCFIVVRLSSTTYQRKHCRFAILCQPADVLIFPPSALTTELRTRRKLVYARVGDSIYYVERSSTRVPTPRSGLRTARSSPVLW
jgi:hypothetical protein